MPGFYCLSSLGTVPTYCKNAIRQRCSLCSLLLFLLEYLFVDDVGSRQVSRSTPEPEPALLRLLVLRVGPEVARQPHCHVGREAAALEELHAWLGGRSSRLLVIVHRGKQCCQILSRKIKPNTALKKGTLTRQTGPASSKRMGILGKSLKRLLEATFLMFLSRLYVRIFHISMRNRTKIEPLSKKKMFSLRPSGSTKSRSAFRQRCQSPLHPN